MRVRYGLDKTKPHRIRVQRATRAPGKRILLWGAVYWRGNCVQVVQRAKGGINCGDLPNYTAIQEIMAVNPDYVLMEAINIRENPATVARTLEGAFAWCAGQVRQGRFNMLVYATPQANSKAFRKWFRDPAHKPPYGARDYAATCSDENCDGCHRVVVDLCKRYGFPLVDIGPVVDAYCAKHKSATFVPHILNDWYHPNQWGAALFGQAIYGGVEQHWPELPIRPVMMPDAPRE